MWWQRRDVVIVDKFSEENFILTREGGAECIGGVENFKYLGRPLDRSDDNWPAVLRNIRKVS